MTKILKTILYVEDDESIAEVAVMAMQSIGGFQVSHFSSAKAALENVSKIMPQLTLIDVMMPEMDGMTFLEQLRQKPDFKNVPVIFMTARVQNDEIKNYLDKGALGVIPKPFDPMKLCELINNFWNNSHEG